jgi:hypothetical protein
LESVLVFDDKGLVHLGLIRLRNLPLDVFMLDVLLRLLALLDVLNVYI